VAYVGRLSEAGLEVRRERFPGMIHGFVSMLGEIPPAGDGIAAVTDGVAATMED
jgi:acetyl esterase/lipase